MNKKFTLNLKLIACLALCFCSLLEGETRVGLGAILSTDLSVYGKSDVEAARLYLNQFGRHEIKLLVEDTGLTSSDGLTAYRKLTAVDKAQIVIAAGTTNGILSISSRLQDEGIPILMASTGGSNVDRAGPLVFRVGNSDVLNGLEQAELFIKLGFVKVALLSEQTEYTTDISSIFRKRFMELGGELVMDQEFSPGTNDFRSFAALIHRHNPQAVFIPTQTGISLGIFLKQLSGMVSDREFEIHTTMVVAPNIDAHKIAGDAMLGVRYLDPNYGKDSSKFVSFLSEYKKEYGHSISVPFHAASVLDSLELVQLFLNRYRVFETTKFKYFLEHELKDYCGFMGCFSLDKDGNSNLGFHPAVVEKVITE